MTRLFTMEEVRREKPRLGFIISEYQGRQFVTGGESVWSDTQALWSGFAWDAPIIPSQRLPLKVIQCYSGGQLRFEFRVTRIPHRTQLDISKLYTELIEKGLVK